MNKAQKALVRSLYTRHGRKKYGMTVCEGVRACRELLAAHPGLVEFVCVLPELRAQIAGTGVEERCFELGAAEFDALTGTVSAPGMLCVLRIPEAVAATVPVEDDFLLALDRIADPGNFGTMVRTARAAGLQEIWFTAGGVDPYADKVIRSSLGAVFAMRLREFADLAALTTAAAQAGFGRVFLTVPEGGESCFRCAGLFEHSVVVIGNEAHGIAPGTPGERVTIPMPGGFESLNAAQAATIVIFESVRRRLEGE